MSADTNLSIARRFFYECWNQGKLDVLDEIMAPNHVHHLPDEDIHGIDAIKAGIRTMRIAFPDKTLTIDDEIAAQDKVVFRWTSRFTHLGDFFGMPPTGNHIEYSGIDIIRIKDDRIVELWSQWNQFSFKRQLNPS